MEILNSFKEAIYSLVNDWIFDKEEIEALIYESLCEHIVRIAKELGSSYVEYELIDSLDEEQLETIEEEERGATEGEILAVTIISDPDSFKMVFVAEAIQRNIATKNPFEARRRIKEIAKHEAFHVRQYNYVIKNGGMKALDRLSQYLKTNHYDTNILEKGAFDYQEKNEIQDLKVFDKFIWPERFVGEI